VRVARRAGAWLLYLLGAAWLARWFQRRRLVVVCYHGVTQQPDGVPGDDAGLHVRAERFRRQLRFLRSRYNVISLDQYRQAIRGADVSLPPNPLLITFDDGKRNCLTAALPLLEAEGLAAAFFVITGFMDEAGDERPEWTASDDSSYLSWADAAKMASKPGYEIGSHTSSHQWLPSCSEDSLPAEIEGAAHEIRSRLGTVDPALAYPWGARDDRVLSVAGKTHDLAFTIDGGSNLLGSNPLEQTRVNAGDLDSTATLALRLAGITGARPPSRPPSESQSTTAAKV